MSDAAIDFQKLLTETLQKQMLVLGPQLTLIKARNVEGLTVDNDGRVTGISGDPKAVSIKVLEQFRELSPLLVKKTMQPLLSAIIASYPKPLKQQSADQPVEKEEVKSAEQDKQATPSEEHNQNQAGQQHV